MCGIVGIMARQVSGFSAVNVDTFKDLLFADEVRGAHGTGIFWNTATKVKTLKAPVPSSFFLRDEKVKGAMNEIFQKGKFAIGHNRHATKGGMDHDSTHPFRHQHITLIHNGTLYAHRHMADVAVDSEAICISIAEKGADWTLKQLDGAFALVWYDSNTRLLNFIRNDERPLTLVETSSAYVICSEAKLADWVISRNKGIIIKSNSIEVGMLHQYDPETRDITTRKVDLRDKGYMYDTEWGTRYGYSGKYQGATYQAPSSSGMTTGHPSYAGNESVHSKVANSMTNKAATTETPALIQPKSNIVPFKADDLPEPTMGVPIQELKYKLGDRIVFSPAAVVPSGNSFCLEGAVEDDSNINHPEVRFYSGDRELLASYLNCVLMVGQLMAVSQKYGVYRYVMKLVKPLVVTENVPSTTVN